MYCVKCGVKLAETETRCPLCHTVVCHPDFPQQPTEPLYPRDKMPEHKSYSKAIGGALIILLLIPLAICFFSDLRVDGRLDWFGYVAGALVVAYVTLALPKWFKKPNPIIFLPCSFAAAMLYLLYINWANQGDWFLSFAFPVVGGLCLITCSVVTLMRHLRRGRLYIYGGALAALGGHLLLTEYLITLTFDVPFSWWGIYPMTVLVLLGCLLIYLAINRTAREVFRRKLFF